MASYGIQQKILIIPNAVDTSLFYPQPNPSVQDLRNGIKLVYFGRLAVDKNLHQLIVMIRPILEASSPSVSLNIVGDGPERGRLEKFVRFQGLDHKIRFTGLLHGNDLIRTIAGSDICISASLSDNQPMALLESLACGVPVVALRAGGVPEFIQNGYNGFLVDSSTDTSVQFVRYLKQLISDSSLRQFMSAHARTSIQRHNEKCLVATLNAYQETIYKAQVRRGVKTKRYILME
jgi:glycosyltransferase involved in cell wall biosynthesis